MRETSSDWLSDVAATTKHRGRASATGYLSVAATTGDYGISTATGKGSVAVVTGMCGLVGCGPYGCICLSWWNEAEQRSEMRCAEVGCGDGSDGKLKANVRYRLNNDGQFVEDSRFVADRERG